MKKSSLAGLFLATGLFTGAATADQTMNMEELYPPPTQSFEVSACTADYKTATVTIDVWGNAKTGADTKATLETFWNSLVDGHESAEFDQYMEQENGERFYILAHTFNLRALTVVDTLKLEYRGGDGRIGSGGPPKIGEENSCTPS